MIPRHLNQQQWAHLRLEYETATERRCVHWPTNTGSPFQRFLSGLPAKKWKHNATLVEAAKKQIVEKVDASLKAATTEAAQIAVKEMMAQLQPWIEREKAEHIKRAVAMGKRGFERIERLWDEKDAVDPKREQFASSALDKREEEQSEVQPDGA